MVAIVAYAISTISTISPIDRLLAVRFAWVGPPPASAVQVSYRGRQALREIDGVTETRAQTPERELRPG